MDRQTDTQTDRQTDTHDDYRNPLAHARRGLTKSMRTMAYISTTYIMHILHMTHDPRLSVHFPERRLGFQPLVLDRQASPLAQRRRLPISVHFLAFCHGGSVQTGDQLKYHSTYNQRVLYRVTQNKNLDQQSENRRYTLLCLIHTVQTVLLV